MPQIIPIKDLKNTSDISEMCHRTDEPIFVTKNGYGDMVIMSIESYEYKMKQIKIYEDIGQNCLLISTPLEIHISTFGKLKRIFFQPVINLANTIKQMYSRLIVFQFVNQMVHMVIQMFFCFFSNDQFISHTVLS